MVLGQPSSGKTTVVKNLVNMALSSGMGWNVGVASLDPSSVSP
jgi:polyribonucleotide 5'-hydroxyl-kinase